jgi:DNA polymerase I-like protein with 3'-5' exonuclease and polymerase domains
MPSVEGDIPDELRERLPARLLWQYLGGVWTDLQALEFGEKLGAETVVVRDEAGVRAAAKALDKAAYIGIDIETTADERPPPIKINKDGSVAERQDKPGPGALDPHRARIATLQLYGGGDKAYVFVDKALQFLLGSHWLRQQHLVAHNAGFELKFLRKHAPQPTLIPAKSRHFPMECTMQATGLLQGVWRRGLDDACKATFDITPPKDLQTSCWGAKRLSDGQVAYATSDAILTWRLWREMLPKMRREGLCSLPNPSSPPRAYELQRDVLTPVAAMELRGLGFAREIHAAQVDAWSHELALKRREFADIAGRPPPSKQAEVREWLVGHADDLDKWPKTKTGLLSTAREHVVRLILKGIPTVKPLLAIMALEKLLENFGPELAEHINPMTGRIHASYKVSGAKSGRFTSSDPNLQQLPSARAPDFRRVIVAAPGNLFVCGDYSQIELRAAAWLYDDPALTKVFADGLDLHRETAAAIAGVPISAVTPEQRAAAKAVNFGSIYGIGAESLAVSAFADYGIEMSVAEAQAALDRFFGRFRVLYQGRFKHWDRVKAENLVRIGVGRLVKAQWEPEGRIRFAQSCNLGVQGSAADVMLRAIIGLHRRMPGVMVCTVHDELLLEVPEEKAEAAARMLEEVMTEAFVKTFPKAPTLGLVDVHCGRDWKEAKG